MPARTVGVSAAAGGYPVLVGRGVLVDLAELVGEHAPAHRYAVIADDRVAGLHGGAVIEALEAAGRTADLFTFPAGEASKTRTEWARLTDRLLEAGIGRDGTVVAVGGGVTGDLAGFVAATFMRGIPVVQVPTSLVAMIDSSVGGKTGVDVAAGKNLVGAFHPPRLVVADVDTTATLPREERAQGLAEAVKHGAISDETYLGRLVCRAPDLLAGEPEATAEAVLRSVEIKADIVGRDEREGGVRQVLNFGHTLGHSLEAASGYRLGHGTAVAAGMVLEAELGERLGLTEPGTRRALEEALGAFGLGRGRPVAEVAPDAPAYLAADKKARAGHLRCVLLERIGRVRPDAAGAWSHAVPAREVERVLREAAARA